MGTDNIDIVLNELDAAVNIDPKTRTRNPETMIADNNDITRMLNNSYL